MHRTNKALKLSIQDFVYATGNDRMSTMSLFGATLLFSFGVLLMVGTVINWANNIYHYLLWVGLAISIICLFSIKVILNSHRVKKDVIVPKDNEKPEL
jgi:hypothetical protein